MLPEVMDWLAETVSAALGCLVIKDSPGWGRPVVVPPCVTEELWVLGQRPSGRVGQPAPISNPTARLVVFGKHEPGMWQLSQALATWIEANAIVQVNGTPVRLALVQPAQRYQPQTAAEQEQHGLEFLLGIAW